MRERIQKILANAGIGSRRQAEAWIAEGRITVNGQPATAGQAIGPRDQVALDGRRVRLDWDRLDRSLGAAYHRTPGESLTNAEGGDAGALERLPKARGTRWIPLSAMNPGEGGLELFVTDGALAAAVMRRSDEVTSEYSLRLRGQFDETRVPEVLGAAARDSESTGEIIELEPSGGEGVNRWARVVTRGLRPRDLKRIFEQCGIEVNRALRTRFGPIVMDRALARGRSRLLTDGELNSLRELAGLTPLPEPKKAGKQPARPAAKPAAKRADAPTPASRRRKPKPQERLQAPQEDVRFRR